MKKILCDRCGDRIDEQWSRPLLEIRTHECINDDLPRDFCIDCTPVVYEAIMEVMPDDD